MSKVCVKAQQSSIDALLSALPSGPCTPQYDGSGDESASSAPLPSVTLEQLLEEDDLLQECKNGHHKLVHYPHRISRPDEADRLIRSNI